MSEYLERAVGNLISGTMREIIGRDDQGLIFEVHERDMRLCFQAAVRELLEDISWDAIEQEARRLFKNNERERGAVRPQVITPEDSMDYWTMVATIAEIRRRAGIGEG